MTLSNERLREIAFKNTSEAGTMADELISLRANNARHVGCEKEMLATISRLQSELSAANYALRRNGYPDDGTAIEDRIEKLGDYAIEAHQGQEKYIEQVSALQAELADLYKEHLKVITPTREEFAEMGEDSGPSPTFVDEDGGQP